MNPREIEPSLHARLAPPATPEGLDERVLGGIRARRDARALALSFDIAASSSGVSCVRPGVGALEASSRGARSHAERAREELAEYLEGLRSYFTVPVDVSTAAPFQRSVLETAVTIPFGEVRSYQWIAGRIGSPRAVRAVGTALGRNPVPILVPCHRVLRSDGALGGYAFGLDWKSRFLALERETFALVGSATTRIVCRHGCPHERRIGERNRVAFASVAEARAAGYRRCRSCLPADGRASILSGHSTP
ncbi:MAG: methylated-DNA--[protein]-cysteine S-methyltransferase [Candidatus Binatia bacterium]